MTVFSTESALERLRAGNRRFAGGESNGDPLSSPKSRAQLVAKQEPFAVVLGCSDSRVPVEMVFDQGLGDLFVVRVAGNVVDSTQIGSVEFAAEAFGSRLVVVLGHSGCGAVTAALAELLDGVTSRSRPLRSIVDRVRTSVEPLVAVEPALDRAVMVQRAVRANVEHSVEQLRNGSETLARLIRDDGLQVVGAEYSLETGLVEFFEGAATPPSALEKR